MVGTGGSSTVNISHTHTAGSIKAAIGAVDGDVGSLGYQPVGAISGVKYTGGYGVTAEPPASKSVNHATQCYGTTDSGGSTSVSTWSPWRRCKAWYRKA